MDRRNFLFGSIGLSLASKALAQVGTRVPRVGFLTIAASDRTPLIAAFRAGLADLGYAEGHNVALEFRFAGGDTTKLAHSPPKPLPRLARECLGLAF